jgi:hypothetical protein
MKGRAIEIQILSLCQQQGVTVWQQFLGDICSCGFMVDHQILASTIKHVKFLDMKVD